MASKAVLLATKLSRAKVRQKFSNKRITRLESDIELDDKRLINRNPRNLEMLSFENKPTGFWLEREPTNSWNQLKFEKKGRYLNAYLKHWSGKKLVEASTKEPQLQKYFVNPNTTQAAKILAQIIARRCLQSGYLTAGCFEADKDNYDDDGNENANENDDDSEAIGEKAKQFFEIVRENGLTLEESPEILPRDVGDI